MNPIFELSQTNLLNGPEVDYFDLYKCVCFSFNAFVFLLMTMIKISRLLCQFSLSIKCTYPYLNVHLSGVPRVQPEGIAISVHFEFHLFIDWDLC
jgi:hypothetical protein